MNGNQGDVQTLMQNYFPYAKYVHCYVHQLNLVIMNACSKNIKSVRLFFANIMDLQRFSLLHLSIVTYYDQSVISGFKLFPQRDGTFNLGL